MSNSDQDTAPAAESTETPVPAANDKGFSIPAFNPKWLWSIIPLLALLAYIAYDEVQDGVRDNQMSQLTQMLTTKRTSPVPATVQLPVEIQIQGMKFNQHNLQHRKVADIWPSQRYIWATDNHPRMEIVFFGQSSTEHFKLTTTWDNSRSRGEFTCYRQNIGGDTTSGYHLTCDGHLYAWQQLVNPKAVEAPTKSTVHDWNTFAAETEDEGRHPADYQALLQRIESATTTRTGGLNTYIEEVEQSGSQTPQNAEIAEFKRRVQQCNRSGVPNTCFTRMLVDYPPAVFQAFFASAFPGQPIPQVN